jgi:hypothetical protein
LFPRRAGLRRTGPAHHDTTHHYAVQEQVQRNSPLIKKSFAVSGGYVFGVIVLLADVARGIQDAIDLCLLYLYFTRIF